MLFPCLLYTSYVPGDYVKKPMRECTGREITEEWLYHLGVPVEEIPDMAAGSAHCVLCMMPYITAFFMPGAEGDRPKVVPEGCTNFAFIGQFSDTVRDTVFTCLLYTSGKPGGMQVGGTAGRLCPHHARGSGGQPGSGEDAL